MRRPEDEAEPVARRRERHRARGRAATRADRAEAERSRISSGRTDDEQERDRVQGVGPGQLGGGDDEAADRRPATEAIWTMTVFRLIAFGRCSRGTSIGTSACRAGGSKARRPRRAPTARRAARRAAGPRRQRTPGRTRPRAADLRDEHQLAPVEDVGGHAAQHRKHDDRHDADEPDHPERQRLAVGRARAGKRATGWPPAA